MGESEKTEATWHPADGPDDEPRPVGCCGKCPPIEGGGYDCTCEGNPRCTAQPTPTAADQPTPNVGDTITTPQDLDALPVGSVVIDAQGDAWRQIKPGLWAWKGIYWSAAKVIAMGWAQVAQLPPQCDLESVLNEYDAKAELAGQEEDRATSARLLALAGVVLADHVRAVVRGGDV